MRMTEQKGGGAMKGFNWDRKIYWDAWSELYEKRIEEMRKAQETVFEDNKKAQSSKSKPIRTIPKKDSK